MIAKADIIEGVVKGMAVLEIFDTERQRLNATLAAQRAGLTRAAARRHLLTLHHLGYLESDGSYFWLSSKVLGFSGSYFASSRLPRVMQPMLERMTAQTGGSFSAVARSGDSGVIVARSADLRTVRSSALPYGLHLGARLPMHATSAGKVLLAALPKDEFSAWLEEKTREGRQLLRLTSRTITDPRALLALIEQIRREDYFFSIEEHELGVLGLAVPLRDMQGCTVAALNVIAPARIPVETIKREFLPLLWETAREARALL